MTGMRLVGAVGIGVSLFVCASVASAQIKVAVEDGSAHGTGALVVAQLNDKTYFNFEATLVNAAAIDTAAELANYQAVILGDSGYSDPDWTPQMADAILAAVQTNGLGFVGSSWIGYTGKDYPSLSAALPVTTQASFAYCAGPTITITMQPGHPISTGLTSFLLPSSEYVEHSASPPDITGGVVLGHSTSTLNCTDSVGNSVVAADLGTGRTAYLGLLYFGSTPDYNNGDLRTGDPDRLLEQTVAWVAHACFTAADCDDGNACNGVETCTAGICGAGAPLVCDDNNACTDDTCAPATGCAHTNNTAMCDDASACTMNDVCSAGVCAGTAIGCDDNNPCTDDTCVAATGCAHADNTASCDDANICTMNDVCGGGTCAGTAITGCCTNDQACGANATCNLATHQCVTTTTSSSVSTTAASTSVSASVSVGEGGASSSSTSAQASTSSSGGEGGGDSGTDSGKGCSCRTSNELPTGPAGWVAAMVIGLATTRRRSRASL